MVRSDEKLPKGGDTIKARQCVYGVVYPWGGIDSHLFTSSSEALENASAVKGLVIVLPVYADCRDATVRMPKEGRELKWEANSV